jgi:hypothetical protein
MNPAGKEWDMKQFHHIGLVAREPVPGETYFESLQVWGTDPTADPNRVEWVRFKPESPLASTPVAEMPHVSWQVDDLDAELEGKDVVVGPLTVAPGIRIAYFMMDGALVEYLEVT